MARAKSKEASRIGLTVDQARQLEAWHDALDAAPATAHDRDVEHAALIAGQVGASFGDKLASAMVAVRQLGGSDVVALLEETGLGNDARMIKL